MSVLILQNALSLKQATGFQTAKFRTLHQTGYLVDETDLLLYSDMQGSTVIPGKKNILYHMIGWMIFITYELSFLYLLDTIDRSQNPLKGYIVPYLINIGLFYFHALITLNLSFNKTKSRYILLAVFVVSELTIYMLLMAFNNWIFSVTEMGFTDFIISQTQDSYIRQLWRGIYFLLFSTGLWFTLRYFANQRKLQEEQARAAQQLHEKQKDELKLITLQNAFLQSQINPHLLFNTLNFIHNKVLRVSGAAADAVITLSDMMRYSLTGIKEDGKVLLTEEVEQIINLKNINEIRFEHTQNLKLLVDEQSIPNHRIIPLTLLPFVENIFKYAELAEPGHPAIVEVKVENNNLLFRTFNKKRTPVNYHSQKIGIQNVRSRLNAHYPDRHSLIITDEQDTFTVEIKVNL